MDGLEQIHNYKSIWRVMEIETKMQLTDNLELVIIELSKARRMLKNNTLIGEKELIDWIKFLVNPIEMEGRKMGEMSEEVKKAYEEWQRLNENSIERDIAERRYLELASIEYAKEYEKKLGREEGIKEGIKEGRKEGERKKQLEIAKKMLEEKIDIDVIEKITELSKEEIEKLKK